MIERLTTLSQVKDYLEISGDESDATLTRLIDAASQFVLTWISRDSFGVRTYTQNFRGMGKTSAILRELARSVDHLCGNWRFLRSRFHNR
jgi:hypothetical protein